MSDENVALLHRLVDAINTDATYHGYDGAIQWRSDLFDVVEDGRFQVDEILATGRAEGYNSRRAALEAVEVRG
jgi:hypothetical protein